MPPVLKRILTALTTATLVVFAIIYAPTAWITPAVAVLAALGILEIFGLVAKRRPPFSISGLTVLLPAVVLFVFALAVLPLIAVKYGNLMLLYVIAIIKVSDMGGFAFGLSSAKLMKGANHKLCPSISPNKSWEGLFGSLFASMLLSAAFMPITHFALPKALLIGFVAALVGTAGDLVESKFKRWAGVKDSATFMPAGLGGFLDMLDSLLLAPAAILILL